MKDHKDLLQAIAREQDRLGKLEVERAEVERRLAALQAELAASRSVAWKPESLALGARARVPTTPDEKVALFPVDRAEYLVLACTIECMRHKPSSPSIPTELAPAYRKALDAAVPLTVEALHAEPDQSWLQGLLGALAAFRGFPELSAAISDLERETACPACEEEFVAPGYDLFT